jgi:Polyketide cyclase / dehydrase and lipid transport
MRRFDVQSIAIAAPRRRVFDFIADPANLPRWTDAFKQADRRSARMETPQGVVKVQLQTDARQDAGTIDWVMTFPDGAVGTAYSRVTPEGEAKSIYSFVLMAPPVPLEALEGALEAQREILAQELVRLREILEAA